jgi:Adenylate and Guanylate cyclase catalytic domain
MPPFHADDFGPACARSTFKVNEDQRELRAHVPDGWRVSEPGAATPSFRRVRDGVIVPWDPVAGVDVEDLLEALRSSFHPKGTAGAPHSCAAGGTPRARGGRRGSGRHPGRHYFGRTVNMASRIAAAASAGQTLVTCLVAELALHSDLAFRDVGPVELKGFSERVSVFEAMPSRVMANDTRPDVGVRVAR